MVSVWRAHIRPDGGTGGVDYEASYALCLRKNVIGVGWRVTERFSPDPLPLVEYLTLGKTRYHKDYNSWNMAIGRLKSMQQNDLVWIRHPDRRTHLCRVVGPWDYRDAAEYVWVDIVNVRPVEIIEVGAEAVPRVIESRFAGGSTIDPVKNEGELATITLWREINASRDASI